MRHVILIFLSFCLLSYLNINSAELTNNLQEIITKDDDVHKYLHFLWCPPKLLGTMCPENSLTHYYYCCGDLRNRCCYTTRTWVFCACLAVPVLIFTLTLIYLLKKIACFESNRYVAGEIQP